MRAFAAARPDLHATLLHSVPHLLTYTAVALWTTTKANDLRPGGWQGWLGQRAGGSEVLQRQDSRTAPACSRLWYCLACPALSLCAASACQSACASS